MAQICGLPGASRTGFCQWRIGRMHRFKDQTAIADRAAGRDGRGGNPRVTSERIVIGASVRPPRCFTAHWRQPGTETPVIRNALFQQTRAKSRQTATCSREAKGSSGSLTARRRLRPRSRGARRPRISVCCTHPVPIRAMLPAPVADISRVLNTIGVSRTIDTNICLRTGSINIYTGLVSGAFSCAGLHCMRHHGFLAKSTVLRTGRAVVSCRSTGETPSRCP